MIGIILKIVYAFISLALFALMGVTLANPLFGVHYSVNQFFQLGVLIAFVGDMFTLVKQTREL